MQQFDKITQVPFHNAITFALAGGISNLQVAPANLATRTATISDAFNLYRVARLRYRIHPHTLANEILVAGYVSDTVDGTVTFAAAAESAAMCVFGMQSTCPSDWANVSSSALRGALPWYKAVPGTPTTWEEVAGVINFASSNAASTATVCLELEGVLEFKAPIDPGLTPAMRRALLAKREKERILKLLATPCETGLPSKTVSGPKPV